ncbi:hypothetical protein ACFL6E_05120 [Candidatus Neomarinimicrobiota bacterium]
MKVLKLRATTTFLGYAGGGIQEGMEIQQIARENGDKVINSALEIERVIRDIIEIFLFSEDDNSRSIFRSTISNMEWFGFHNKLKVLGGITQEIDWLEPAERKSILNEIKEVIKWRNAFAHGRLISQEKGVYIHHRTGNKPRSIELSDEFWETVEQTFLSIQQRLTQLMNGMEHRHKED